MPCIALTRISPALDSMWSGDTFLAPTTHEQRTTCVLVRCRATAPEQDGIVPFPHRS
eukprot:m.145795 g.145795  ORF g.145795 m.145795 type:complete len:57 (+) comp17742_c0_seq2:1031-1201(+)